MRSSHHWPHRLLSHHGLVVIAIYVWVCKCMWVGNCLVTVASWKLGMGIIFWESVKRMKNSDRKHREGNRKALSLHMLLVRWTVVLVHNPYPYPSVSCYNECICIDSYIWHTGIMYSTYLQQLIAIVHLYSRTFLLLPGWLKSQVILSKVYNQN